MGLHHKIYMSSAGHLDCRTRRRTLLLPHVVAFNAPAAPDAMARITAALDACDAAQGLRELTGKLQLRTRWGSSDSRHPTSRAADRDVRDLPNPRLASASDVRDLLTAALKEPSDLRNSDPRTFYNRHVHAPPGLESRSSPAFTRRRMPHAGRSRRNASRWPYRRVAHARSGARTPAPMLMPTVISAACISRILHLRGVH